jgi:hypothetical protein
MVFASDEKKKRFESFVWSFGLVLKNIRENVESLRKAGIEESRVISYIRNFVQSVEDNNAREYFNFDEKLLDELGQMNSIGAYKEYIDRTYPLIDLKGKSETGEGDVELDFKFLQTQEVYEQYRHVHFHYKMLEVALNHVFFDHQQEPDYDRYISKSHGISQEHIALMSFDDKQKIVQDHMNATLQDFCDFFLRKEFKTTYHEGSASIKITNRDLNAYPINENEKGINKVTIRLHPNARPKSEAGKLRKGLDKEVYAKDVFDYWGSLIKFELIELEQLRDLLNNDDGEFIDPDLDEADAGKSQKQRLLDGMQETMIAIRMDLAKKIIPYIPSITGCSKTKKERTRAYLHPGQLKESSASGYMAIQMTMPFMTLDNHRFNTPNEFIL